MKVALDATPLTAGVGGIARYTAELRRALMTEFPQDTYTLISDQPFAGRTAPLPDSWIDRRWWLFGVQRALQNINADLFHGTDFSVPYLPLRPSVMTIHDLSPWKNPAWHFAAKRVRQRAPLLAGLGIATMIITPSEAIRSEVIEHFRVPPARVVAVPEAAAPNLQAVDVPHGSYILYVGTLEPRKNLAMLLDAWRAVRKKHDVELVLAGRRRQDFPELPAEAGLRVLGEVAESDLPALYSGAIACVYPSLYEGFGLPVLEAMQCGAAVITSRDAAITEVAKGAAEHVDADDKPGWVNAISRAITDTEWISTMRQRSLRRAREFNWERTARLTHGVYEEAVRRFA